ncbi:hypothetical protein FBULB1_2186 [Fusarium bulbicola]|nr:hypothetical protein FBULB1_2186 [Fusarium bulbicola]
MPRTTATRRRLATNLPRTSGAYAFRPTTPEQSRARGTQPAASLHFRRKWRIETPQACKNHRSSDDDSLSDTNHGRIDRYRADTPDNPLRTKPCAIFVQ